MHTIIGDIHGHTSWQELIQDGSTHVFVGDYVDSKDGQTTEQVIANWQRIIEYKKQHPETVLLYGNHELHYMLDMDYRSRYAVPTNRTLYCRFIEENAALFHGVAYAIDERTLVSHAGVTKGWYEKYIGPYRNENAYEVAERINALWQQDKMAFTFRTNVTFAADHWGESPTHSPLWIRSWVLPQCNLFAGTPVQQIIGHTPQNDIIVIGDGIICVDCLHKTAKALKIER